MASRSSSYKMKATAMDKREKKLLRVHRRSIDQREQRHEEVNKRRQLDNMSPVLESADTSKNTSKAATPKPAATNQKAALSRLEMLKNWKEERELKRKLETLEKARNKPSFRVTHVSHNDNILFAKDKQTTTPNSKHKHEPTASMAKTVALAAKTKPAAAKPASTDPAPAAQVSKSSTRRRKQTVPTTRTTRSTSRAAAATRHRASPSQKKLNTLSSKTSKTRTASSTRQDTTKEAESQEEKAAADPKDTSKVSTHRGDCSQPAEPSFAPGDFVFEAPASVPSFVFKPLSPNSAAIFFFPSGNSTTMSTFTDRVERTSTPNGQRASKAVQGQQEKSVEQPVEDISQDDAVRLAENGQLEAEEQVSKVPSPASQRETRRSARNDKNEETSANTTDVSIEPSADSGIEVAASGTGNPPCPQELEGVAVEKSSGMIEETQNVLISSPAKMQECSPVDTKVAQTSTSRQSRHISRQATPANTEALPMLEEQQPLTKTSSSRRRSTRRQTRGVQLEELTAARLSESKGEKTPPKSSCRSRRSSAAEAEIANQEKAQPMEVVQEEEVPVFADDSEPQHEETEIYKPVEKTPAHPQRSRRSAANTENKSQVDTQPVAKLEPVAELPADNEVKETPSRGLRRSRRSSVVQATAAAAPADNATYVPVEDTPRKTRRSRRSSAAQQISAPQPADKEESTVDNKNSEASVQLGTLPEKSELEKDAAMEGQENDQPAQYTSPVRTRSVKRGVSKDDGFLTPGLPMSAQRQSATKRRRTATMVALSSAKSPEEAIKIISNSPMVEMTRRMPKTKTPSDQDASHLFDDVDTLLAKPVRLFEEAENETAPATAEPAADSAEREVPIEVEKKRDVTPFREQHSAEILKLTALADKWTAIGESNLNLSEEVQGQIRTVACQARLLMAEKLNQFSGLVDKCEAGDPFTNCQDLQGFWDMVYIQALDVYEKFDNLDKLQHNNWKIEETVPVQPAQKAPPKKRAAAVKKDKPAGKSQFAEFRVQLLKQHRAQDTAAVTEQKVFDAGFFKVSSPVKSPQYHCEGGAPKQDKISPGADAAKSEEDVQPVSSDCSSSSETVPEQTPTLDNKENMHEMLLHRSVGGMPFRRSYVPSIPSPLLQDITPQHKTASSKSRSSRKSIASYDVSENGVGDGGDSEDASEKDATSSATACPLSSKKFTPRRSTRVRKSVCLVSPEGEKSATPEQMPPVDFMAYLHPSSTTQPSPFQVSGSKNSPFSCDSLLNDNGKSSTCTSPSGADSVATPKSRLPAKRKSSLKMLPSTERRRSRRSVSFAASPQGHSFGSHTLPSTPYNRNSLVAGRRISQHMSSPGDAAQSMMPQLRRSARPSLLYTPPDLLDKAQKVLHKDVPVATLVSFSP